MAAPGVNGMGIFEALAAAVLLWTNPWWGDRALRGVLGTF